ncbi:MAG: histidine phosphatase family protein [Alphaproteobacteria bacterium]|nr:histidine phosphatase family protein [Alphaproteobacteria bacterium]
MTLETRWWWVRHAPVPTGQGIVYGQLDLPCDCDDPATFQNLAQTLPPDAVLITSDLRRTVETASAIRNAGLNLPAPIKERALREQNFGTWQGMTHTDFAELPDATPHRHWRSAAYLRGPEGESFADVVARVAPAIDRLTAEHAGADIVAVAHGGTIRAALAVALGLDPESALSFATETLSLTRLDHIADDRDGASWRVSTVNSRIIDFPTVNSGTGKTFERDP